MQMLTEESTIKELFEVLAKGEPKQFKEAKRLIEKKWRTNKGPDIFRKEWSLMEKYIKEFDSLPTDQNKSAVISGMSLFYFVFADDHFEILKDFAIKNLTSQNGQIREAMRHTADWLYGSLSSRIHTMTFLDDKPLIPEEIEEQKVATKQFFSLVKEVENLMEQYDDEKDGSEYIDQMKPSVNKTLQMFWSRFVNNRVYRSIVEKNSPISLDLMMKRKEIESELSDLLSQADSYFDVEDVKQAIYEEDSTSDMQDIIAMFDTGEKGAPSIDAVLEVISDAWNHFPHRSLDGLCPQEMMDRVSRK